MTTTIRTAFIASLLAMAMLACGPQAQNQAQDQAKTTPPAAKDTKAPQDTSQQSPAVAAASEEFTVRLAKLDLYDGTKDHVISKCASCNMMMDGKEEHNLVHGKYQMHFCSSACKKNFSGDTQAKVMAMEPLPVR